MPTTHSRVRFILRSLALACICAGAQAEPSRIVTSILPIKYFVDRVGGTRVATTAMVGAGASPETYEPTSRQMVEVGRAAMFVAIGVPYERAWLGKIARQYPRLRIVDCKPPATRDAAELDPHVWTSPRVAQDIVACIDRALRAQTPRHAEEFRNNAAQLIADLGALDREIRATLDTHAVRSFLVYHPAWDYFARDYGLEQIAIEHHGKAPPAQHLARVIERARAERLRVVFVQRQLSGGPARAAARELEARVVEIDPLAEDYLSNLRSVAAELTRVREAS